MHGVVEKIENFDFEIGTLADELGDPLGRMLGKTANTRAADDDGNLQLAHEMILIGLGGGEGSRSL
jgi:hypothetical protein